MRFTTVLQLDGATATGITVPDEVLAALGGGRRPKVVVTLGGHTYRSTVGSRGGVAKIPVSAAVRAAAGVAAGDTVDVDVQPDDEPREVTVPDDLAAALDGEPAARTFYEQLPPGRRQAWVTWVESAKQAATRERRVREAAAALAQGRAQR